MLCQRGDHLHQRTRILVSLYRRFVCSTRPRDGGAADDRLVCRLYPPAIACGTKALTVGISKAGDKGVKVDAGASCSKSAVGRFSRPRFNDRRLVVGFNDAASATAEKQLEHQKRRLRHAESQGDPTAKRLKIRTDTLAAS